MTVWQHVKDMDHIRRRAESLIEAARRIGSAVTPHNNDHDRHRATQAKELRNGYGSTPALSEMSGWFGRKA